MTLTLGSMAVYAITNSESLRSPFGDTRVFASNIGAESQPTLILPPIVETAAPAAACETTSDACCESAEPAAPAAAHATTESSVTLSPVISAGMTSEEVRSVLGEPDSISSDGARWSYGSSVIIMNSANRVAGHIAFDPIQAALNKYNHMLASVNTASPETKTVKSTGPKILTAKSTRPQNYGRYAYRPMAAGSSRNAYRYDRNQNEYSYYMNRHGPMDRIFTGKRFLPRGMTNSSERNLAQSYLNYGAARYSNSTATQYRR
jgi:hypothetical protein